MRWAPERRRKDATTLVAVHTTQAMKTGDDDILRRAETMSLEGYDLSDPRSTEPRRRTGPEEDRGSSASLSGLCSNRDGLDDRPGYC